ncbi:MAG TPA: YARHG domain-containing protein [Pyrinomonadaceae bacterium]|nr:YARHG domain-containing protein [Pyrinomonadaceae bacterium]
MRKLIIVLFILSGLTAVVSAQTDFDPILRAARWKEFNKNGFEKFDFAKKRIPAIKLKALKVDEDADQVALLRGVVFGKHGRIFKERSIQDYLEKQPWYKANAKYSNSVLTKIERDNLDAIRLAEAARHPYIEPGDMRVWKTKLITDDNLRDYTGAELTILAAEVEAIHGKPFDEEWLQKYFDERYWYKKNPAYDPVVLTDIERKNIERLHVEKDKNHKTAIAIGDMDHFQNVLLTEDKLTGLTLLDLRLLREEFYARHGKKFDAPGIRDYFNWRDWYKPAKNQKTIKLNAIEQKNVDLLAAHEDKLREWLATTEIDDNFLGPLFAEDLRVLRNEIYARHGRVFKDAKLQAYFETQAWYKADPDFKDDQLSEIEVKNLAKIREAEESATSKFSEAEG